MDIAPFFDKQKLILFNTLGRFFPSLLLFCNIFSRLYLCMQIGAHFVVAGHIIWTQSRGMNHMSAIFNFDFSTCITCSFKMLHFYPNPISIGHLVAEI